MLFRTLRALILTVLLCMLLCGAAFAVEVEQTQLCMPELDVYVYESEGESMIGLSPEDVTATLSGEPLETLSFSRNEQGVFYVYMLDISGSMPVTHFDAAKQAIIDAQERLRPQDKMALITFGSTVNTILEGGESREKAVTTISALRNSDQSTRFYDAMDALLDIASGTDDMKRIAVVISDGINASNAEITEEQLRERLISCGVSVNALCIDTTAAANTESFRELVASSGGHLYLFGRDDAGETLDGLLDILEGGWLLKLLAPTNEASGVPELLSVDFGGRLSVELHVTPVNWTPDDEAPSVLSAKYDAETGVVTVIFSEPVTGADDPANYSLNCADGPAVPINSAECADSVTCVLHIDTSAMPTEGVVTLTVTGCADISMEENPMRDFSGAVFSAPRIAAFATPELPLEVEGETTVLDTRFVIIILVIVGVMLLVIGILLVLSSQQRGSKLKKEREPKEKDPHVRTTATFLFVRGDEDADKNKNKEK